MSRATTTIEGFLASDGELKYTRDGLAFLGLSIPHTARRRNKQTGDWEDVGNTLWTRVTLWGEDAEAFAEFAVKGTAVIATGTPMLREYQTRDGGTGISFELNFPTVTHRPRLANHSGRGQGQHNGASQGSQEAWADSSSQGGDPWAAAGPIDETPF